jgi:hypothetical protein
MTVRSRTLLALVASFALLLSAGAAPPTTALAETRYLIEFVEGSGCEFYRNGTRYDAARAGSHLRDKYTAVAAAGEIGTAEVFIEKVASRSSLTGRPYEVSCAGHERVLVADWLREELYRYRMKGASRDSRDAR